MKKTLIIIGLVIVAIVLVTFLFKRDQAGTDDTAQEAQVRELVTEFGTRLQDVSLIASEEQVVSAIENAYAPYVTPELLAEWTENPSDAPGRLTSSPWPDRIEISSVQKDGDAYMVEGDIILMTSVETTEGGNAGTEPVELTVEQRGEDWLISAYSAEIPAAGTNNQEDENVYTHEDPAFSISYPSVLELHEEQPEGREEAYWSELALPDMPGETFATFHSHEDFTTGTNLSSVRITVGESSDAEAVASCTTPGNAAEATEAEINGVTFTKITSSDAGAGNFYETASYRIVRDESCFAIESVIHSTNIGNYPEGTVTEFDRAQVEEMLEESINSFQFG